MKTNTETAANQPARHSAARSSSRKLRLSWLATLVLATSGTATAATVQVSVAPGPEVLSFDPDSVTIAPGDTVEWIWSEFNSHAHSVTSGANGTSDGLFDSAIRQHPYTFSFTFPNAGTFHYFCRPHYDLGMAGRVIVDGTATPSQPLNISTRLRVEAGDNVLIGGFIISGTQPKKIITRAIGPSLPLDGAQLADPVLELHGPGVFATITNDNWRSDQEAEIIATTIPPNNNLESAIVATLPANNAAYTAIVNGKNATTGVGLVEVYDLDRTADSKLANISTRGLVQTGNNVMIGGFILGGGNANVNVLVRAIGPSLSQVSGALADPTLELRDGNGALLRSNDNWKDSQRAEIEATGIPPQNDLESAIVAALPPGAFTAIVAGKNSTSGVGLVEVYRLQ